MSFASFLYVSFGQISLALRTTTMSSKTFLQFLAKRRTYYQLTAKSPISDAQIQEIIEQVILNVPSAFNSQTVRVVLLVKDEHQKLWDIVTEVLKVVVPEHAFPATEKKLNGFRSAYGTVRLSLFSLNACAALADHQGLGSLLRSSSHDPRLSGKVCFLCR